MDKRQLSRVLREWTGEHTVASSWLSAATCFEFGAVMRGVVRIERADWVCEGLIFVKWAVRYNGKELSRALVFLSPSTSDDLRRFASKEEALEVLIEYLNKKDESRQRNS